MMQFRKLGALAGTAALFLGSACVDLDVTNPNNPDIARALASPEDVQALAHSTVRDWYINSTYYEPYLALMVTADQATANFGNFGMRFNNLEPRKAYENNSAGGDREVTRRPWDWTRASPADGQVRAAVRGVRLADVARVVVVLVDELAVVREPDGPLLHDVGVAVARVGEVWLGA